LDDTELLMAIYQSIKWDELYERAPDASREEVDELFRRVRTAMENGEIFSPPEDEDGGTAEIPDRALLRCDGASSGNPGPAGIGMALYDPEGEELQAWGIPIGEATNNVAEYRALIAGLKRALKLGISRIEVRSDSQLMVRQISGRYKVKSKKLKSLYEKASQLIRRFESCEINHVSRDRNERVDEIAKQQVKRAKNARA
jgi:ribonuclease HI